MLDSNGLHLLAQGHTVWPLTEAVIRRFLADAPAHIGMTAITQPEVFVMAQGIAGIVIIAESHISIHTKGTMVWADVFSCKGFAVAEAQEFIRRRLSLIDMSTVTLERNPHLDTEYSASGR